MDAKERLLRQAGYAYNFDRLAYVNHQTRKVFAVETLEDHGEDWLERKLAEPNTSGSWKFYDEPPAGVRRALVAELENAEHTHR